MQSVLFVNSYHCLGLSPDGSAYVSDLVTTEINERYGQKRKHSTEQLDRSDSHESSSHQCYDTVPVGILVEGVSKPEQVREYPTDRA